MDNDKVDMDKKSSRKLNAWGMECACIAFITFLVIWACGKSASHKIAEGGRLS